MIARRLALSCAGAVVAAIVALAPGAAHAEGCSNAKYRTGASAALPDCRAFEIVSPSQKHGVGVRTYPTSPTTAGSLNTAGLVSPGGDSIAFTAGVGPATDDAERGFGLRQVARRTDTGWMNQAAITGFNPSAPINGTVTQMRYALTSDDGTRTAFASGTPMTPDIVYDDATPTSFHALYLAVMGAPTHWLTRPLVPDASPTPGQAANVVSLYTPVGGSSDLHSVFFATRSTLTQADIDAGRAPLGSWGLYRWKDGQVSGAAELPGGGIDPGGAVLAGMALPNQGVSTSGLSGQMPAQYRYGKSVSLDGSHWAFVSPDPHAGTGRPAQLYLAHDSSPSKLLSTRLGETQPVGNTSGVRVIGAIRAAQSQSATTSGGAVYAVSSSNLKVVIFATADALVDGVTPDPAVVRAYRYDATGAAPTLEHLADLDRRADQGTLEGDYGSVLAMSDDGSRILYRNEADQLKLWREGLPAVTISGGVGRVTAGLGGVTDATFSPNGEAFIINSRVALRANPLHPAGAGNAQNQVYHYDEAEDRLTCVSCPQPVQTPTGPSSWVLNGIENGFGVNTTGGELQGSRGISSDGKSVYFTTLTPLTEDDHNARADVYEWNSDRGTAILLSSGSADSPGDWLIGSDAGGENVFFTTDRRLVEDDVDDLYDVYVARVGGGLRPRGFDQESACDLGDCQHRSRSAPAPPPVGSALLDGDGNLRSSRSGKARTSFRTSRLKSIVGKLATIKVTVPGSGRIRVRGAHIVKSGRAVSRAGTYSVRIRLRPAARKALRKSSQVKARVRVSFRASGGGTATKVIKVTFKGPKVTRAQGAKGDR